MPLKKSRFSKRKPKSKMNRKIHKKRHVKLSGPMKEFNQMIPYPRTWNCKFKYTATKALIAGTGGVFGTTYKFSLNNLHDPDITNLGHYPYGYNQMKVLYARYIVSAVLVEVVLNDPSEDGLVVGVLAQASTGVGSIANQDVETIIEQPYSWCAPLNNSGTQVKKFKQFFPIHKIEGLSKMQYHCNLTGYAGTIGYSPANVPFIEFGCASDRATSGGSVQAHVSLTYYSKLYDPVLQARST